MNYIIANRKIAVIACALTLASWICLLALVAVIFFGSYLVGDTELRSLFIYTATIQVILSIATLVASKQVRCGNCHQCLLSELGHLTHPNVNKNWPLNYWATNVLAILLNKHAICVHCGAINKCT